MDRMYAPWRLAFVKGEEEPEIPSPSGCIFCDYPLALGVAPSPQESRAAWDRARLVVSAREHCFIILNKYPYGNGHLMVVPRAHTQRLDELPREAFLELHEVLHETVAALRQAYQPHGMNLGMNMGRAGGAGIEEHVHYHALPRWNGDVNFMPVLADTKVISEGLDDTYQRVVTLLRRPEDDAA
jgi:ATP adenylyltransferase